MKIGVFCPNWVGDLVMATPALRGIRNHFPQAEVVGIMRPYLSSLLEGTGLLDRVLPLPHGKANQFSQSLSTVRDLQREEFDLVLLMPNSLRSAIWAFLSGARSRVGFARNGRSILLTQAVPPRSRATPHPVLQEYLRLAEAIGCKNLSTTTELSVSSQDRANFEAFWERATGNVAEPYICLNPGGAFGAAKHWPVRHFATLARRIVNELGRRVLVLCGPAEREIVREIVRLTGDPRVVSLAEEELSLGLTKAAIQQGELLVTTDSGPRQFAPPFGVKSVVLYGPTHQGWSTTPSEVGESLQLSMDCGPCQQRTCPLKHHRCMEDLTPDRVFAAVFRLLEGGRDSLKAA